MLMSKFLVRSLGDVDRRCCWSRRSAQWRLTTRPSRRSKSTNGRSGSATRPSRPSMPRASTTTPCRRSSAPAGPSSKRRRRLRAFRSRRSRSCSSSARRPRHRCRPQGEEGHIPVALAGEQRARRAGCSGSSRTCPRPLPPQIPPSYLPETHWFAKLRDADPALYLKYESHFERFIAYDTELSLPMPLKIRGGPDEYTLQNLTGQRLLDVAVIVPTPDGYRVGWLDELPTAAPEKKKEDASAGQEIREGKGRRLLQGRGEEEGRRRAASPARRGRRQRQGQGRPAAQPAGGRDGRESPAARGARPDHRASSASL